MVYLLIAAAIFGADLWIKNYIERTKKTGRREELWKDKVIITKYHNYGAFLNLLEKKHEIILLTSGILLGLLGMIMIALLPQKGKVMLKLGISFLFGGASSNVYDRIRRGYVVDYLSFSFIERIVFNISDFFIFFGCILVTIKKALE